MSEFTSEEVDIDTDLDPALQKTIMSVKSGGTPNPSLCHKTDDGTMMVDVLAVLKDVSVIVPDLHIVRTYDNVVTGSVAVDKIEAVKSHGNVVSLKSARVIAPNLRTSVAEIRARQQDLKKEFPTRVDAITGSGVIVGIVDYGCDFAHRNFKKTDGSTRILYLWDQNRGPSTMSPDKFGYGREFTATDINAALAQDEPYVALSYSPQPFENDPAHGTHVMDIAAGNGRGTGSPGVAPEADIIFVQLASGDYDQEQSFGNSRRLVEAVDYIFDKAQSLGKQCVVNLSLGTHGGPHDGSTPAERAFETLLQTSGRAIVISAGNSRERGIHASATIAPGQSLTLPWEKAPLDKTDNELEIWYPSSGDLTVTLATPAGESLATVHKGAKAVLIKKGSKLVGKIINRANDPLNTDNNINIFVGVNMPAGSWQVRLENKGTQSTSFHAWIERDDSGPSRFASNVAVPTHTLGSISCGTNTIVVASYNAAVMKRDISNFSSEGPTRDGKQKPEIAAPGHQIIAAASTTGDRTVGMSGTSMAAPHVTGLIALLMQAANRPLSISEIRSLLVAAGRRNPPQSTTWDSRFGNGRIDAVGTLKQVIPANLPVDSVVEPNGLTSANPLPLLYSLVETVSSQLESSKVKLKLEVEIEPCKN